MLFVIVIDRDVQPHRTNAKGPEFSVAVAKERVANCKAKYLLYGESLMVKLQAMTLPR